MDIDAMYFGYCILLQRPDDEFWDARPCKITYCLTRRAEMIGANARPQQEEVTEIHSMHEIAGWGCHGR